MDDCSAQHVHHQRTIVYPRGLRETERVADARVGDIAATAVALQRSEVDKAALVENAPVDVDSCSRTA